MYDVHGQAPTRPHQGTHSDALPERSPNYQFPDDEHTAYTTLPSRQYIYIYIYICVYIYIYIYILHDVTLTTRMAKRGQGRLEVLLLVRKLAGGVGRRLLYLVLGPAEVASVQSSLV